MAVSFAQITEELGKVPMAWGALHTWLNGFFTYTVEAGERVDKNRVCDCSVSSSDFSSYWTDQGFTAPPEGAEMLRKCSPFEIFKYLDGAWALFSIATSSTFEAGNIIEHPSLSAPSIGGGRWLMLDGRTIGSALSGGTVLANDNALSLFTFLWTNFANTELVIQTSAGSNTTRGGSALADFNANKRMPLPDRRGRIAVMMDNPGTAGAANRLTSAQMDVMGGVFGSETHAMITAEMPSHNHTLYIFNGTGGGLSSVGGGATATTSNGAAAVTTVTAGSGTAHNNVQPVQASIFWIYY